MKFYLNLIFSFVNPPCKAGPQGSQLKKGLEIQFCCFWPSFISSINILPVRADSLYYVLSRLVICTFQAQEYLINFEQFQDKSTQRLFTYVNFHSEKNVILSFQLVDGCKMYFLSLLFTISPPRLESNNEINVVPSFVNVTQAFCHVINTKIYEKL